VADQAAAEAGRNPEANRAEACHRLGIPRMKRELVAGVGADPTAVVDCAGWGVERSIVGVRGARRDRSLWGCMKIESLCVGERGIVAGCGFGMILGEEGVAAAVDCTHLRSRRVAGAVGETCIVAVQERCL
jgi:hypothetical protein